MNSYITIIDLENATAQLNTGEQIPITHMYDKDQNKTSDPAHCRGAVAGPCSNGLWYGILFKCRTTLATAEVIREIIHGYILKAEENAAQRMKDNDKVCLGRSSSRNQTGN